MDSLKHVKEEFFRWKKQLVIVDVVLSFFIVVLLGFFYPDVLMIWVYFLLYPYLFLTSRKAAFYHLFVASFVAIVWMLIAKDQYGYNRSMVTLFGLNSYTLFAMAAGLFGAYLIYSHFDRKYHFSSAWKKLLFFSLIWVVALVFVETVAYHWFNIRNVATASYAGLPLCDCIHAPVWMQVSYFVIGPIYFFLCELFGLENPQ